MNRDEVQKAFDLSESHRRQIQDLLSQKGVQAALSAAGQAIKFDDIGRVRGDMKRAGDMIRSNLGAIEAAGGIQAALSAAGQAIKFDDISRVTGDMERAGDMIMSNLGALDRASEAFNSVRVQEAMDNLIDFVQPPAIPGVDLKHAALLNPALQHTELLSLIAELANSMVEEVQDLRGEVRELRETVDERVTAVEASVTHMHDTSTPTQRLVSATIPQIIGGFFAVVLVTAFFSFLATTLNWFGL